MFALFLAVSVQIGDPGATTTSGSHCTAICGKSADSFFDMDRCQIRDHQCPVHRLLRYLQFFCENHDGDRSCDSLVAASGIDHHRKFTAVHSCIGTGSCHSLGAHLDILIAVSGQQNLSDIGSVIPADPFLGDRHVVTNLTFQYFPDICKVHFLGKCKDIFYGKHRFVCQRGFFFSGNLFCQKDLPVSGHIHQIRVKIGDPYTRFIFFMIQSNLNIKDQIRGCLTDTARDFLQEGSHRLDVFLFHMGDDFQFLRCISRHDSGSRCGFDSA